MNKSDIQKRIDELNEYMLSDSEVKLLLLKISNEYTYNKGLAFVNNESTEKDWYGIDYKYCTKTWNEMDAYIDGICKGKNLIVSEKEHER